MRNSISPSLSSDLIDDTLSTAIIVLDATFTILKMNAAAENLFGQSRERVINKSFSTILNQELNKDDLQFALDFVSKNAKTHVIRGCDLHNKQERITTIDCIANSYFHTGRI